MVPEVAGSRPVIRPTCFIGSCVPFYFTLMHFVIITAFPEFFPGPLGQSLLGKALAQGLWKLNVISLREYGKGAYKAIDDHAYGGGAGMVICPEVIDQAVKEALILVPQPEFLCMSPRGQPLQQHQLQRWAGHTKQVIILCGRYEGMDERVLRWWNFQEISIGDFVLCGGEIPAMTLIEGCVRLLPKVLGNPHSIQNESFNNHLLEHAQYTRPAVWNGQSVPEALLSGHHELIARWQCKSAYSDTQQRRPDLWKRYLEEQHC